MSDSRLTSPSAMASSSECHDKFQDFASSAAGDSGFISGPCTTESDLSMSHSALMSTSDLTSSAHSTSSSSHHHHIHHKPSASQSSWSSTNYSRLDSGVDVSVSDGLSELNLSDEPSSTTTNFGKKQEVPSAAQWELFFMPDEDGDTALHLAIMQGNEPFVVGLIGAVPHPSILDFQNNLLQTPLHVAVLCKQPMLVRRLVVAGARVDMRDRRGNTALHLAANAGDLCSLQALSTAISCAELEEMAGTLRFNPFAQPLPQGLDLTNYDGQGPIHLAAQGGHSDVLRALHWLGAAVNAKEGKGGRTALHYAVERGHLSALLVLANECRVDLEADNYAGLTAYQIASASNNGVESSSLPLARELRRCGAIPHDLPMDDSSSEEEEEEEQNNSVNNLNGRSSQQQHHHNHCP